MLKRPNEPARLHSKAGECRSLIKFGMQQAALAMAARPGDRRWELLHQAAEALHCLSGLVKQELWDKNLAIEKADTLLRAWMELSDLDQAMHS